MMETLQKRFHSLPNKTVTLGFDGFIDSLVRVVLNKDHQQPTSYFESIQSFGNYIVEKGGKNFSLELEEITTRIGGNMPLMANALAHLGLSVSCVGSLGYPTVHPAFQQMPPNCHLYSFANPGTSKVLEFATGKIMMAEMGTLNQVSWEFIRDRIGIDVFLDLFSKSDMIALLNWSEMDNSTEIWKGLLRDVLPKSTSKKRPAGFFDLSDCSKRTHESIKEAMDLIRAFSRYWDVALSLNRNEAGIIHSVLTKENSDNLQPDEICKNIFDAMQIDTVVIHGSSEAVAWNREGVHKQKSFYITAPAISVGSGDNFNAGFCMGRLLDLDMQTSLAFGHATSCLYMQAAQSPDVIRLIEFLSEQGVNIKA